MQFSLESRQRTLHKQQTESSTQGGGAEWLKCPGADISTEETTLTQLNALNLVAEYTVTARAEAGFFGFVALTVKQLARLC